MFESSSVEGEGGNVKRRGESKGRKRREVRRCKRRRIRKKKRIEDKRGKEQAL